MSFYETPRRNASDSTSSTRSMNRGHRREHSDPCPLPSPGLPHKALSTPELLRSKTVGDPCSAIRRSCSSLAALRTGKEPVPPNADGFEELRVQAVRKNTKGKARGNRHLFYDKCIIHDARSEATSGHRLAFGPIYLVDATKAPAC